MRACQTTSETFENSNSQYIVQKNHLLRQKNKKGRFFNQPSSFYKFFSACPIPNRPLPPVPHFSGGVIWCGVAKNYF